MVLQECVGLGREVQLQWISAVELVYTHDTFGHGWLGVGVVPGYVGALVGGDAPDVVAVEPEDALVVLLEIDAAEVGLQVDLDGLAHCLVFEQISVHDHPLRHLGRLFGHEYFTVQNSLYGYEVSFCQFHLLG